MSLDKSSRKRLCLKGTQIPVEDEIPMNEPKLRATLKSVFTYPMIMPQICGYIPFAVDKSNQLQISGPVVTFFVFNIIFQILQYSLYFYLSATCKNVGGNDTDKHANLVQFLGTGVGGLLFRIWIVKKRAEFKMFHETLNKLTCSLVLDSSEPNEGSLLEGSEFSYITWVKEARNVFSNYFRLCFMFSLVNFICLTVLLIGLLPNIPQIPILFIVFFVGAIVWLCIHAVASPSLAIWFASYTKWLATSFNAIAGESQKLLKLSRDVDFQFSPKDLATKVNTLWNHLEQLECLVDKFNMLFGIPIFIWVLSTSALLLQQTYIVLRWIQYGFYTPAFATIFVVMLYPLSIWSLCNACFEFSVKVGGH